MPYTKTLWQDDVTPLSATNLNKIESGIETAQNTADTKLDKSGGNVTGPLNANGNTGVTINAWGGVSVGSNGDVLVGNNCYIDTSTNALKYRNTHASIGARGIIIKWSTDGQAYFFDTGNISTTADAAFTPTLQKMWNSGNSGNFVDKTTVQTITAMKSLATGNNAFPIDASGGQLEVRGNGTDGASVLFHRPGAYATYFGLDTDNQFKVGGYSAGANKWKIWHEGNDTTLKEDTRIVHSNGKHYYLKADNDGLYLQEV